MNVDVEKIIDIINSISNDVIICGHKNADYDSMCSSLALGYFLKQLNKNVMVYIEPESICKIKYFNCDYLLYSDIKTNDYTFIAVDLNRTSRLPSNMEKYYNDANYTINIDHHNGNTTNANAILSIPDISSTCEIIYAILKKMNFNINKLISELLFTGIVSDTNLFSNNTSTETHIIVSKLLKNKIDSEYIINKFYLEKTQNELEIISYIINNLRHENFYYSVLDMNKEPFSLVSYSDISKKCIPFILNREDIDVLMIIMDYGNKMKGEIRSKNDIDVSKIASLLTGGGHTHAAGFANKKKLNEIITITNNFLEDINNGN